MMQQIAQATDGQYFHAEDGLVFERVFDILHQKIATPIFQEEKYISQSIVLPCVFFLCILSIIHTILVFQMRKI